MSFNYIHKESSEKEVFEEVFKLYFLRVKMFIFKIVKSEDDAEDMAQDIFVKLWSDKNLLGGHVLQVDAYIFRMAKNKVYNYISHKYIKQAYIDRCGIEKVEPKDEVFEYVVGKETELIIKMVVDGMPTQRKKIFKMSRERGMSNKEIAEELNLSKKTIDNHLSLALADLSKIICFTIFFIFD